MNRFVEAVRQFNSNWNDLPRRLLLIALFLLALFLLLIAFPYVAPFALAALFAWMIDPLVRFVTRRLSDRRIVRVAASAFFVLALASVLILVVFMLLGRIITEIGALASVLPSWVRTASQEAIQWIENLNLDWTMIDADLEAALMRLLSEVTSTLTSLASRMASTVARIALQTATLLPQGILFLVLTLLGTFYMSADKQRIFGFLSRTAPENLRLKVTQYRASMLRAVFSQFRAALIMLCVSLGVMSISFMLMGIDYAIVFAVLISLLDALPVLGSGLFLIPMALYGILIGNATLAAGSSLTYLTMIVVRQFVEPRVIGRSLGLHPLATMMAMYAGLVAKGVIGMILGPMMLLLCKVALSAQPTPLPAPAEIAAEHPGDGEAEGESDGDN